MTYSHLTLAHPRLFAVLACLGVISACAPAAPQSSSAAAAAPTPAAAAQPTVASQAAAAPTTAPQSASKPTAAPASAPVNLRFTVWTGNAAHLDMLNGFANAYKQSHPNVSVKFDTIPFDDYVSKLTVQLAGGSPPDGGWIAEGAAPTFVDGGVLVDMGPTLKQVSAYNFADLSPAALKLWSRSGAVYGVPFSTSPLLVIYNQDLLEAAGTDTPRGLMAKNQWTWDALATAAKAVVAKGQPGIFGFESLDAAVFTSDPWSTLMPIIRAYGGDAWSADGKQCQLDSPQAVAAIQLFHKMVFTDKSAVSPSGQADFYSGQSAITLGQLSRTAKLADATFKWDIAPLPGGPAGNPYVIGQAALVTFTASKNKEAATDFVAFMTNAENVATMARFFPPARLSVLASDALPKANPQVSPQSMSDTVVEGIKSGAVLPSHPQFPKIDLAVRAEFDKLWQPDADVQVIMSGTCKAIAPLLVQ